jgi:DNA-binding MarR family transcriptional regulator
MPPLSRISMTETIGGRSNLPPVDGEREQLVRLLQLYATEADQLGQVFAERHGLHPTDLHALLAVMHADRAGAPLTPGRLGQQLGLSSGATTALVDRLERVGHVRRVRDDRDRRRVALRYGEAAAAVAEAFFGPLGARMDQLLTAYSPAELAAVRRFLTDTVAMVRAHHDALRADGG